MSFSDPQTISINGVSSTLVRTGSGVNVGSFSKDDGTIKLGVSSTYGKRQRRTIRLDHTKYAADPLNSALNVLRSMSVYVVIDTPLQGYSLTEEKQIADALVAYLSASSGARITQLLSGEN